MTLLTWLHFTVHQSLISDVSRSIHFKCTIILVSVLPVELTFTTHSALWRCYVFLSNQAWWQSQGIVKWPFPIEPAAYLHWVTHCWGSVHFHGLFCGQNKHLWYSIQFWLMTNTFWTPGRVVISFERSNNLTLKLRCWLVNKLIHMG